MRLQYKVTLFIFSVLIVIGIAGAVAMLYFQRQAAESQFEKSSIAIASAVNEQLVHAMLEADRDNIQHTVELLTSREYINEVIIVSTDLKIFASGDPSEIGKIRNDEEFIRALESGELVVRTETRYGQDELCVIYPVMNQPDCYSCHDSRDKFLGAIEIGVERGGLIDQLKEQTVIMLLIGGITFVAVGGLLALMFRSAVVKPLSKIASAARKISQGDFSARANINTKDEVGMMALTFNEMARQIEQYAIVLEDSKRQLEQGVQERTQQLQQMATVRGQLLERLISAQEEERRRIARELHDEAGQALAMIMLDLARTRDSLPSDATEAKERVSRSRSLVEQTLTELRKVIYELRPEVLDTLGLVPALRSYIKSRLQAKNIKVQLHFLELKDRLLPEVEITLFRVIQEAITNILRHSGASMVEVRLAIKNSTIIATVADNGTGFDVEAAFEAPDSWGLRGIRERLTVVGGELDIESKAGYGTRIEVRIPLGGV